MGSSKEIVDEFFQWDNDKILYLMNHGAVIIQFIINVCGYIYIYMPEWLYLFLHNVYYNKKHNEYVLCS